MWIVKFKNGAPFVIDDAESAGACRGEGAHVQKVRTDAEVNAVYCERNKLVAALARFYPSGTRKTAIEGWDPEWHGCVFIDTPQGQMSWHFHDSEAHLFAGLPAYTKPWDGHTTDEKYKRLAALGPSSTNPMW